MALTRQKKAFARFFYIEGMEKRAAVAASGSKASPTSIQSLACRYEADEEIKAYAMVELSRLNAAVPPQTKLSDAGSEQPPVRYTDPMKRLEAAMNSGDEKIAVSAATALMPYHYCKLAAPGLKDEKASKAREKSKSGKFATVSGQLDLADRPS